MRKEAKDVARSVSVNIFLMDGTPNGKVKASNSNWNTVAYKIPREQLSECKDFDAFKQSGVYFLFGLNKFYVGQAEVRKNGKAIHQRILEHTADKLKDEWEEVVMFTAKDNSLGMTDISYLENRFYHKAKEAGRFKVLNASEPTMGTVTEEKMSDLEQFIDWAELLIGAMGYKVFEPIPAEAKGTYVQSSLFVPSKKQVIPPLPDENLKIGEFIKTAMINLSNAGYVFTDAQIAELTSTVESKRIFNLQNADVAFLKLFDPNENRPHEINGNLRYYAPPTGGKRAGVLLTFGGKQYLLTKEWYDKYGHRENFITWYNSLGTP